MTDDCADLRFRLMLFRRGELDAAGAEAVHAHLATCPDCTAELAAERELDRRLLAEARGWSAPAELRSSAGELLARARGSRRRRWGRGARRALRHPLVAGAIGAA